MYSCRIYLNTGFNENNIPDSPALLENSTIQHIDVDPLDIMQNRNLSEIKVRVPLGWDSIKHADYLKLDSAVSSGTDPWYYAIDTANIQMVATDIALLPVVPDYILSVGGVTQLHILDGVTTRVHVSDDSYGLYTAHDELLAPAEPMEIATEWVSWDSDTDITQENTPLIEATVDPAMTFAAMRGAIYEDADGTKVTVPSLKKITSKTSYFIRDEELGSSKPAITSPGTCLFPVESQVTTVDMKEAIASLRSLGVEQCIIKQITLPKGYCRLTKSSYTDTPAGAAAACTVDYVIQAEGKDQDHVLTNSHMQFMDSTQGVIGVNNNRIQYSEYTKYGMVTSAGESLESDPADLYPGASSPNTAPTVRNISDPHPDGRPYFRFKFMNHDSSWEGFWRNCVAGMKWKEIPLIFQGASGSLLNQIKYDNNRQLAANEFAKGQNAFRWDQGRQAANAIGGVAQMASGADVFGGASRYANSLFDMELSYEQNQYTKKGYRLGRKSELTDLVIANTIVAPTVNFPFNSEVLRDFRGNGVLVYRLIYTGNDRSRIDKLLTMYGYKFSKPLEISDFTNRTYFNFVACDNCTFTGYDRAVNEGLKDQLSAGVRVWHVLPSASYYSQNNPIVSNS